MQYPTEVPGVRWSLLRTAYQSIKGTQVSALAFRAHEGPDGPPVSEDAMVQRYVNQGFSGGEKKRNEIIQLAVLEPQVASSTNRLGIGRRLASWCPRA
jgi:Fe-S cluster assembly ATP-binding protein